MGRVKECIPCLGADVKEAIRALRDSSLDVAMEKVADCPDSLEIDLCVKPPRKKSEYQAFISVCMKEKPIKGKPFGEASKYLTECAVAWRKRKEDNNGSHDSKVYDTAPGQLA